METEGGEGVKIIKEGDLERVKSAVRFECERCGDRIPYDEAYRGYDGYLCEYCHDDLFD